MIKAKRTKSHTKPSINDYTPVKPDVDSRHTKMMEPKMEKLATNKKAKMNQDKPAKPNTSLTKQKKHQTKQLRARKRSLTNTPSNKQPTTGKASTVPV